MTDESIPEQDPPPEHDADAFAREAAQKSTGPVREFWNFLRYNKKWWLTPIILTLLLVGVLIILSTSAIAPLIYPLF